MNDRLLKKIQENDPSVTSVQIEFNMYSHSSAKQETISILKALLKNTMVTTLCVKGLTQDQTKNISTVFKRNTSLISVEFINLSDDLLKALEEGLHANTSIKKFICSSGASYAKDLTRASFPIFVKLINEKLLTHLEVNNLKYTEDVAVMIDAVLLSPALVSVSINDQPEISRALSERNELLSLFSTPQSVIEVKKYGRHPSLFNSLIENLKTQIRLVRFSMRGEFLRTYTFPVQTTTLLEDDFTRILSSLAVCSEIQSLDFACNSLTNAVMPKLIEFLKGKQVVELNLSWNQFTDEAIIQLADFLAKNTRLVKLDLSGNPIRSQGVLALAKAMAQNKTITSLNLNNCPIEETALTNFIDNITPNGSLIELELPYKKQSVQTYQSQYSSSPVQRTTQLQPPRKLTNFLTKNNGHKDEAILATIKGDSLETKKMMGYGVSPYVCDENLNNLLHLAVKHKHFLLVKYFLLEVRMNPNIRNKDGRTARDLAQEIADTGDKRFIECFSMPVTPAKAIPKQTSLAGFISPKRPLDESPAVPEVSDPMQDGLPAVLAAAAAPVDEGAKKQRNDIDVRLLAQFYYAALNGNSARVQELLTQNVPIDIKNNNGETALHAAARGGHNAVAALLVACGASITCTNLQQETPLHLACDLNNTNDTSGVVRELLEAPECKVNAIDVYGRTPLYCLVGNFYTTLVTPIDDKKKAKIAQQLLAHGADPTIKIFDMELGLADMTPLHKAVLRNLYKLVTALLNSLRCSVNAQNGRGRTALHEAVAILSIDIVDRLLIEPGIDLTIIDNQRQTALDVINDFLRANEAHPQALQIKQLIEQRMVKRMLSLLPTIHYATSLNLFFGRRGKPGLLIDGEGEHARLKSGLKQNTAGNELTASLTFIVRNPDKSRCTITVNLQGEVFHPTMAWKERVELGAGAQKRQRSPDALQRIVDRVEQIPAEVKERCVEQHEPTKPLNATAITTLFKTTTSNPSFEYLFHHSEQGLLDFLEKPETIKIIVQQLLQNSSFQSGCKIYPAIILRLHSKHYVCVNCEISLQGEQNTKQSKFLRGLFVCLDEQKSHLSVTQPLRMIVCVSAETPAYSVPFKKKEAHQEYTSDLRVPYPNVIIERTFEPQAGLMNFTSRR